MKIRDLVEADYPDWLKLYEAYADHYEMALTPSGLETTWTWLMDDAHPVTGIVAETDAGLVGLAQFRAMPNPLRGHEIGFLDDLVVSSANIRTMHAYTITGGVEVHFGAWRRRYYPYQ